MKRRADLKQTTFNFDVPEPVKTMPGSLFIGVELRHLLSEVMKHSPRSRYEIAGKMSEFLGVEVTKSQLDSWTSEARDGWRFPLEYLCAFEAACESSAVTEFIARKSGGRFYAGKAALSAELGRLETLKAELTDQIKQLRFRINERA